MLQVHFSFYGMSLPIRHFISTLHFSRCKLLLCFFFKHQVWSAILCYFLWQHQSFTLPSVLEVYLFILLEMGACVSIPPRNQPKNPPKAKRTQTNSQGMESLSFTQNIMVPSYFYPGCTDWSETIKSM